MLSLRSSNDSVKNYLTDIGSVTSSDSVDHPTDRVRVYVRIRPLNSNERSRGHKSILQPINDSGIIVIDPASFEVASRPDLAFIDPKCWSRNFTFDYCLWSVQQNDNISFATQDRVFEVIGQPVVNWALEGHNCCIFAYGQTGTGKSYTMMGNMAGNPSEYGLIPRICYSLFDLIEENNSNEHENIIEFSHLEIYNETVRDLLSPSNNHVLKVREHPNHGVYVANLTSVRVSTFEEIMSLISVGDRERTVASTNMNAHSSRSHAIVTLTLRQSLRKNSQSNKLNPPTSLQRKTSRLHLVDLAGSERATLSGATGHRLRETNKINRSLSVLGDVIKCLGESRGGNKKMHIPYRNSLLTMVLKDSLGGNAHTVMMAAVSPSGLDYEETVSTLKYADRAKRVRMRVQANVMNSELGGDAALELVPLLKAEVKKLREMLLSQQTQQQLVLPAPDNQLAAAEIVREMQVRVQELERQLAEREKLIQSLVTAKSESSGTVIPSTTNSLLTSYSHSIPPPPSSSYLHSQEEARNIHTMQYYDDGSNTTAGRHQFNMLPNNLPSSHPSNNEVEDDDLSILVSCLVDLNPNSTLSSFSEAGVIAIPDDEPLRLGSQNTKVDILLPGSDITPLHCIFTTDNNTGKINLAIPDNNATVTINNHRIFHHYALRNLDSIGIGSTYQFRFEQHRVSLRDFNGEEEANSSNSSNNRDIRAATTIYNNYNDVNSNYFKHEREQEMMHIYNNNSNSNNNNDNSNNINNNNGNSNNGYSNVISHHSNNSNYHNNSYVNNSNGSTTSQINHRNNPPAAASHTSTPSTSITGPITTTATTTAATTTTVQMMEDFSNDVSFMNRVRNIEKKMSVTANSEINVTAYKETSVASSGYFPPTSTIAGSHNKTNDFHNDNDTSRLDDRLESTMQSAAIAAATTTPVSRSPPAPPATAPPAHSSPSSDVWWDKLGRVAEGGTSNEGGGGGGGDELQQMLQTVLQRAEARSTKTKTYSSLLDPQGGALLPRPSTSGNQDNSNGDDRNIVQGGPQTTTVSNLNDKKHFSPKLLTKVASQHRRPVAISSINSKPESLLNQPIQPNTNSNTGLPTVPAHSLYQNDNRINNNNSSTSDSINTASIELKTRFDTTGSTLTNNNNSNTRTTSLGNLLKLTGTKQPQPQLHASLIDSSPRVHTTADDEVPPPPPPPPLLEPTTTTTSTRAASTSSSSSLVSHQSTTSTSNTRIIPNPSGMGTLKPVPVTSLPKGYRIPVPAPTLSKNKNITDTTPAPPPLPLATAPSRMIPGNMKYLPAPTTAAVASTGKAATGSSLLFPPSTHAHPTATVASSSSHLSESELESQALEQEVEEMQRVLRDRMLRYQQPPQSKPPSSYPNV